MQRRAFRVSGFLMLLLLLLVVAGNVRLVLDAVGGDSEELPAGVT